MKQLISCKRCGGIGSIYTPMSAVTCGDCSGTGKTLLDTTAIPGQIDLTHLYEQGIKGPAKQLPYDNDNNINVDTVIAIGGYNEGLREQAEQFADKMLQVFVIKDYKDQLLAKDMFIKGFMLGFNEGLR